MPTPIRTSSDLGAWIRDRRTSLGLDQLSLAKKAGVSRKWLIEAENGKPRAEIGPIFRILKALGGALTISDSPARPKRSKVKAPAVDINQIIDSLRKPR